MNQEPMSARQTLRIVRRYRKTIACAGIIGCAAGAGYGAVSGHSVTSQVLIALPAPLTTPQFDPAPIDQMQTVVVKSDPVLSEALSALRNPVSIATLRGDISSAITAPGVLSVTATTPATASSREYANAVAQSYITYVTDNPVLLSGVNVQLLQPATSPAPASAVTTYGLMALLGVLIGVVIGFVVALVMNQGDRRLRQRGEVANAVGLPVLAALPVYRATDAPGWLKLLQEYEPPAVDSWQLRTVIEQLGVSSQNPQPQEFTSIAIVTLSSDQKALALGPQFAVYAASRGIPTTLVIGSRQDTEAVATLRTAGAAYAPDWVTRRRHLRVVVPDRKGIMPSPDPGLAVHVVVVDERDPQVPQSTASTVTMLGLSSGAVNAAQLARAATAVTDAGSYILGILMADPEPSDFTTGLDPRLGKPALRKSPDRLSGLPTEIRP